MTENFLLKDMFNQESVKALAEAFAQVDKNFNTGQFITAVFDSSWDELELKGRVRHITVQLARFLPGEYPSALDVLIKTLPLLEVQGFVKMVFPDFVELFGQEEWKLSISALEIITQHVSGEFAIRPFIANRPEETLHHMLRWADHPHPGVRRLASEGCRPRLPWGMRLHVLIKDPRQILPILEKLKDDPREEIRRSVANNLNDISKDHPYLVVDLLSSWQDEEDPQRVRLIKHALRTLLKRGHPGALELLGFSSQPQITISGINLEPAEITLGGEVIFSFKITSTGEEEQPLMIDYQVNYLKANGTQAPKVFKLSQKTLQPGQSLTIRRKHTFKPITTRKYYPGVQTFQPQVNGVLFGKADLMLRIPEQE